MNLELSEIEKCALGGLTFAEVNRDDGNKVSLMYGNKSGSRQGKGSSTLIRSAKEEKLTMSLSAYRAEEQRRRAARATQASSSRSERGNLVRNLDADLTEDFLDGVD